MYVLIALGLALVYGVMKIPNFAHGEYYLFGAYAAYFALTAFGLPPFLAIIFAAIVGFVLGAIIERLTFAPLRKRNTGDWVTNAFMIGAGIQLIIQNGAQYIFSANYFGVEKLWSGNVKIGGFNVSYDRLVAFAIAMVTLAVFWLFLKKTKTGISISNASTNCCAALSVRPCAGTLLRRILLKTQRSRRSSASPVKYGTRPPFAKHWTSVRMDGCMSQSISHLPAPCGSVKSLA